MLARLHFVVRPAKGQTMEAEVAVPELEQKLAEAARSWEDDFVAAVREEYGESQGSALARKYADSFPEAYKEDFSPRTGASDLGRLEGIEGEQGIDLSIYEQVDAARGEARLKIYRIGPPLSLSQILPMLSSMGVEVVDERPYELEGLPEEEIDALSEKLGPVPCPLLDAAGRCRIYEDRPSTCRFMGLPLVDADEGVVHPEWCEKNFHGVDALALPGVPFGYRSWEDDVDAIPASTKPRYTFIACAILSEPS